jgi:hypothetical protein
MVLVHLLRARDLPGETNLVERLLTGGQSDPYVVTEVKETRGADLAITKTKVRVDASLQEGRAGHPRGCILSAVVALPMSVLSPC